MKAVSSVVLSESVTLSVNGEFAVCNSICDTTDNCAKIGVSTIVFARKKKNQKFVRKIEFLFGLVSKNSSCQALMSKQLFQTS